MGVCLYEWVGMLVHKVTKSVSEIKSVIDLLKHEEVDILIKKSHRRRGVCIHLKRCCVQWHFTFTKWYSAERYINGSGENLQLVCT